MARLKRSDVHLGENSAWIQVYAPKTKTYRFAFLQREATTAQQEYLASRQDDDEALLFFATWWVENGGDTIRLQHLGGWATPEMLEVYVLLGRREDMEEAHRRLSPADHLLTRRGR